MKKLIVVLIAVTLIATMFVGCNDFGANTLPDNTGDLTDPSGNNDTSDPEQSGTNIPPDTNDPSNIGDNTDGKTYTLLLYENTLSGLDDTVTKRASGRIIENKRVEIDDVVPDKTTTLFGKTHTLKYHSTSKRTTALHNRVTYEEEDEKGNYYIASFDSVTGALMSYTNGGAGKNRAYRSEVNDKSSEAEFLAYAKKLVSQYASVEGCEVEISTKIYEYNEESKYYAFRRSFDSYVNNTENVSDYYAIYQFVFYKTIDGIRRFDTNVIEIHSTGEVYRLSFNMQDELYADFTEVDVDMEQAERITKKALAEFIPGDSTVEIVPSLVATNDGMLWLHLEVFVKFGGGTSGYIYVIHISGENTLPDNTGGLTDSSGNNDTSDLEQSGTYIPSDTH